MKKILEKNKLYDIKNFPKKEGLVIFPISMSRAKNSQSGRKYKKYIESLNEKVRRGNSGITFLYTDKLYEKYNSREGDSKNRNLQLILDHKNQFVKNMRKEQVFAENAFEFVIWMQLIVKIENFGALFSKVKKLYKEDKKFQKYIKDDMKESKKKIKENNINFLLEEALVAYLILNHEVVIPNSYVNGRDKWRLLAYPGKPNKSMIYLFQKNMLNKKTQAPYRGQYDLESKKFYNFDNIDLETLKF